MNRISKRIHGEAQDGFTLIELLIVMVVLGILAGIAILAAGQFRTEATNACNTANTRIDSTVTAAEAVNPNSTAGFVKEGANCGGTASPSPSPTP